jgi:hypothetical protein
MIFNTLALRMPAGKGGSPHSSPAMLSSGARAVVTGLYRRIPQTMLCLAAVNRVRSLPRLAQTDVLEGLPGNEATLRRLRRNTALDIALGLVVLYVVGLLGVTPPSGHVH